MWQKVPNLCGIGAGLSGFELEGDELGEFGWFDDGKGEEFEADELSGQ
jgi:hypothetical protein